MTDQKAQELTDTELDAALAERDKADKAPPWPQSGERRTADEVREFTDQELDAALAQRDKADKAAKALLPWPLCGERRISKKDRRSPIVAR